MLVTAAVLVIFLGTASSEMLLNISGSLTNLPSNCIEAVRLEGAEAKSGIYQIQLPLDGWAHRPFYVYCQLDDKGGDPWLVVQRRQDEFIDFERNWADYKLGFGNLYTSFWIGLDKLYALTQVQLNELQIKLSDFDDADKYAKYDGFAVGDENEKYALNILGSYSGCAGDSLLEHHSGQKFSTYDEDNDNSNANCAQTFLGGWWYRDCLNGNLNGKYLKSTDEEQRKGIIWQSWRGFYKSLKYAHMAIRPKDSSKMRVNKS